MSTFILYNKRNPEGRTRAEKYGLKSISSTIFKRLLYNDIHKKFKFEVSREIVEQDFETELKTEEQIIEIISMI